jgi:outer membrane protein assembly factor BamB
MPHALLVLAIVAAVGDVGAWPQFRGARSDADVGGGTAPLRWSDDENVVWKKSLPGLGWSSPIVAGGRVYVTTAAPVGEGLSLRALALDAESGSVAWDTEIRAVAAAPAIHFKNSHASPTPILRDGALFVHFGTLGTARLAAHDGTLQWLCTELEYPPVHGSGGSPVLSDGILVIVCDGGVGPFVAALDAESGKIAWKTPRSVKADISHSFVTPLATVVEGRTQVLAPGPDHCAAYDLATGAEIWRVRARGWSVVPQPLVHAGLAIYNHDYDHPELMAVRLGGAGDVTESHVAWRRQRGAPSTPTPLLVGEEIYTVSDNGVASCFDARTGAEHWMRRIGGNYSASPVHAEGRVLFLSEQGAAVWVRAAKEFEIVAKNEVSGKTLATPAFDGRAMYLRTDEHLLRIEEPPR